MPDARALAVVIGPGDDPADTLESILRYFAAPADPLALRWKGLPAPPAALLAQGKLAVHSIRSSSGSVEGAIRDAFAAARQRGRD